MRKPQHQPYFECSVGFVDGNESRDQSAVFNKIAAASLPKAWTNKPAAERTFEAD
jgi:hypothetical protein